MSLYISLAMRRIIAILVFFSVVLSGCICPPAEWEGPVPPWCTGEEWSEAGLKQSVQEGAGGIIGAVEDLPGKIEKYQRENLPAGTPVKINFEVAVPETERGLVLHLNGEEIPMEGETNYYFESGGMDAKVGDGLSYYYSSGDKRTETLSYKVRYGEAIRNGLLWTGSGKVSKPGFIKGHTVMDAGGFITNNVRDGDILETYDSMVEDGGEWFAYDYYWSYIDAENMPKLVNEAETDFGAGMPSDADFGTFVSGAKSKGLNFMMYTEVEWNVTEEERLALGDDWDAFFELLNEKWAEGQAKDREMGERIVANPDDPEAKEYWDAWFENFENYMMYAAKVANENDIKVLALGKQLEGPMKRQFEQRWRNLIAKVRSVYDGKLTQVVFEDGYGTYLNEIVWADDLDFVIVYSWEMLSEEERPSIETLVEKMRETNGRLYTPFYEKYGTPIVMLLAYQSRDYSAKNEWFEPMASAPQVKQDLVAQADLYEAFFRSTLDEEWLAGVMTWGYWVEDDFKEKYSFEKSSSVRNKPASLVVRKWHRAIED